MKFYIPTKEEILSLQVGDLAPTSFKEKSPITSIHARQQDINGKWFICYYAKFGENSTISHSLKENKLDRSVSLISGHTSHELDEIEKQLLEERYKQ